MIDVLTVLLFAIACSICYYWGSRNRVPYADKALSADNNAKLTEIFKLRRELQQQTALAVARGEIIRKMEKDKSKP